MNTHFAILHYFRRCRGLLAMALLPVAIPAGAQTPPPSGLHAWFKADAGVTVSAGNVTAWTDQTANAFVLTPPGPGPVFTTGSLNGLPALTFNGTQQLNGNLVTAPGDASVFALCRYTIANSDNDYLYTLSASTGSGSQLTHSRRNGQAAYHFDGSSLNVSSGDHMLPAQWLVSSQIYGGVTAASHELFINGAAGRQSSPSTDGLECQKPRENFRFDEGESRHQPTLLKFPAHPGLHCRRLADGREETV